MRGEFPNAIVYPNGKILLIPDTHLEAVCHDADLRDFWADQNCTLKYGSWTYDGNKIDLKFFGAEVDVSEFRKTNPIKVKLYKVSHLTRTFSQRAAVSRLATKFLSLLAPPGNPVENHKFHFRS